MEYNRIQLRTWSMLGKRGTFGSALTEFAPIADNLMAVSADFTRSSGLERYSKVYSDKFLNVGIAEQNLIGVSSGLASEPMLYLLDPSPTRAMDFLLRQLNP